MRVVLPDGDAPAVEEAVRRNVDTRIDPGLCSGCGECVLVCPSRTLSMLDGVAAVTGTESLGCGHCVAVCPSGAITVESIDPGMARLATIDPLSLDRAAPGALVRLMQDRRSCRRFRPDPVDRRVLEDLVRIATLAPSGTNSQAWTFTVLPTRDAVMKLGNAVGGFFRNLNRMAEKPHLRLLSRLFGGDALGRYRREYYESVKEGLREYDEEGRDRLFHGATAAILIGSGPGASCPAEDALLAADHVLLACEAMGLGTCLIGFAIEAFRHAPQIKDVVGVPRRERVYAVIALGHPAESWCRPAGRRRVEPRWVE
ncbi:MAG: nitroreductase family protein [Deltaproteobacteria bacterium]|nr:nitroreductase family protein [Deltaproteobacteria bacterium]